MSGRFRSFKKLISLEWIIAGLSFWVLIACAGQNPVKVVTLPPVVVAADPAFVGAWKNAAWDAVLVDAIKIEKLTELRPADAQDFGLDPKSAAQWAKILVTMAKFESAFNPRLTYQESFNDSRGRPIISSGLFQISLESSRGYGCAIKDQAALFDPETNIRCSVKILARLVKSGGRISGKVDGKWRGGSAYWAVLRGTTTHTKKALEAIRAANKGER